MSQKSNDDYATIIEKYEVCIAQLVRDIRSLEQQLANVSTKGVSAPAAPAAEKRWRHVLLGNQTGSAHIYRLQIIDFATGGIKESPRIGIQHNAEKDYGVQVENGLVNVLELPAEGTPGDSRLVGSVRIMPDLVKYRVVLNGAQH